VDPFDARAVRAAYGAASEEYADTFADDLGRLPLDRAVLDTAVERLAGSSPVLDVGCGPAQVGQYLADRGREVIGLDLSPEMLTVARRRTVGIGLACADMRALPLRSNTCEGAVAFYSLHHIPRQALRGVLADIRRVLTPAGILVVATHLGEGEVYSDEFLGHEIATIGGTLYRADDLIRAVEDESFRVEVHQQRAPLPHEHESERIYLIARAPVT
jgi:SAM-dependent methyltransferase